MRWASQYSERRLLWLWTTRCPETQSKLLHNRKPTSSNCIARKLLKQS